ncbi:MAG: gamma-glutamyl-gamma-aminobutyrate hydrolase family protein [Tannerella sp.]|jgi:putative glutamine amidotransferase|nr:gamma-glutamyl-gamma-aminobutyrate hydrolase family protein [Tannerella sp.]
MKHIYILLLLLLSGVLSAEVQKRPIIGICDVCKEATSSAAPRSYIEAVLRVNGIPVIIPYMDDDAKIKELLNTLDGVLFVGGEDFAPEIYHESPILQMGKVNATRDRFEINLLRHAYEQGLPVLGICRGLQLINVTFGGSLYQDIPTQYPDTSIKHRQSQPKDKATHAVVVRDSTVFAGIVGEKMLMVNSFHHQAVKALANGFEVGGVAMDSIIESIEKVDSKHWVLGVQFHPEGLLWNDKAMVKIFQRFVEETNSRHRPEFKMLYLKPKPIGVDMKVRESKIKINVK